MSVNQVGQYVVDGTDQVYMASTQAGVATSTGLATTQTGFTLTNPLGSGKNLVVLSVDAAFTSAPAAAATLVLAANVIPQATQVVQTTPLVVRHAALGNSQFGVGLAASAVTLPAAPVVVRGLGGPVATGSLTPDPIHNSVNGALVLIPGSALSVNSLTTAISAVISMTWREVQAF